MKVIVDTDVRIDDAQAIVFLLASKDVELKAITLVAGNAGIEIITPNAEKILTFLDQKDIPIYVPGGYNLDGIKIKTDWYFGKNGFAEIELPEQDVWHETDMSSVEAMIYYSKKYPHEISAIFMGPLTNLALAFLVDNDFPSRLANILIVGGDRAEKTFQNASEYAEFNAWCDPHAYMILQTCILRPGINVTMIDWTACLSSLLPFSLFTGLDELYIEQDKYNPFLKMFLMLCDKSNKFIKKNYWENGFLTADLFAAVGLVHPSIFTKTEQVTIKSLETSGSKAGHMVFKDDKEGCINLVSTVDTLEMAKLIISTLSNPR